MSVSKLSVVSGHLGSGKTEFSLNYSTFLKKQNPDKRVVLCDLDFINPYFRSRRHKEALEKAGVEIITPVHKEVEIADIPSVSSKVKGAMADPHADVIIEVGGDDAGAIVIGHLNNEIKMRGFEHYMVLNVYRPDTNTREKAVEMIKAIEKVSRLPITRLIFNNHLMYETTAEEIINGYEAASAMQLDATPAKYICINERFMNEVNEIKLRENEEWFILRRFLRYAHEL